MRFYKNYYSNFHVELYELEHQSVSKKNYTKSPSWNARQLKIGTLGCFIYRWKSCTSNYGRIEGDHENIYGGTSQNKILKRMQPFALLLTLNDNSHIDVKFFCSTILLFEHATLWDSQRSKYTLTSLANATSANSVRLPITKAKFAHQ